MKIIARSFLAVISLIALGCATKEAPKVNLSLAGNRQMAVGLKTIKSNSADKASERSYFLGLLKKSIVNTYGSKVGEIHLEKDSLLESPDNLFQIGKLAVDDLFVVEATVVGSFVQPAKDFVVSSPEPILETSPNPETIANLVPQDYVEFSVSIYNGSNLRAVNIFSFKVPTSPAAGFEASALEAFRKASTSAFPNPNIYPKSEPKHYADLLYNFSETREKENTSPITCEDAPTRLHYYAASKELYDMAIARGTTKAVGTQAESHLLTTRQSDSALKAKIVEDCLADQAKHFELNIVYGSIVGTNQEVIKKVIADANLEPLLKQYTSKPVNLRFQVDPDTKLNLFVDLRFDRAKYKAWTLNRIPSRIKNFQILSLDPYYALMQKLVLLKAAIPSTAPLSLKSGFENMKILLNLNTLINGEVSFAVDGKPSKDQKHIDMAYPNAIYIALPNFDRKLVQNRDVEIFREKGWIALGNCKTIEGTKTEDGLIYDFFGLPCQ